MRRYGLRDDQWDRIKDLLPGREGHVGVTAKDNRLFVEAVLYRYRAGMPWRDLPERFGDWKAVHTRHTRWAASGVWEKLFKALAIDTDNDADARVIEPLLAAGKTPVIPSVPGRSIRRLYDRDLYKERHLIENFFCRLKLYRAIATRYDKRAVNFLAGVYAASILIWLN
jgi:transposase